MALALLCFAAPASAQVNVVINGEEVTVQISILGIGADFSMVFDEPENLNVASLGISVQLISPLSARTRQRMPSSRRGGLSLALPLKISVNPPSKLGLSFKNTVGLELHTHLLPFEINSPLRLYKSDNGGPYYDITDDIQPGSVRVRGRTGGFSDFIIVVDLTPNQIAAEDKFDFLAERIVDVPDYGTYVHLERDLSESRRAFNREEYSAAIIALDRFRSRVQKNAGTTIPNVWRAQRDLENIAGDLVTESSSLRYALTRLGG
jgi:hypothetical protein